MKSFFLSPEQYETLKGRYAKFNEPWTEEETEELKQMAADGVARADMSQQLGRSPNAIKMKLQALGLYVPKPAARPWSADDDASLVRQYLAGASFASLAASFGRSENAILRRLILLRAGLPPAGPAAEEAAAEAAAEAAEEEPAAEEPAPELRDPSLAPSPSPTLPPAPSLAPSLTPAPSLAPAPAGE